MRTFLTMIALFSVMITSAQGTIQTKEYYQTRSKNQKTVGYVLAGTGAALIISGILVGNGDNNQDPNELDFGPNFDAGVWLLGGGLASGLASIPFFISADKNARKAAAITIAPQKINYPQLNTNNTIIQPAISVRIRL